jgi:hypothetical protein
LLSGKTVTNTVSKGTLLILLENLGRFGKRTCAIHRQEHVSARRPTPVHSGMPRTIRRHGTPDDRSIDDGSRWPYFEVGRELPGTIGRTRRTPLAL